MRRELDQIDREIIRELGVRGRASLKELASRVFLSSPAVASRIEHLERDGFITGYCARIDPKAMGYPIKAFISLEVRPDQKKEFYPYIREIPNVVECSCVTGAYSMLLEGYFTSTSQLDQFIGELHHFGKTSTQIVFSTSVEHRQIMEPAEEE